MFKYAIKIISFFLPLLLCAQNESIEINKIDFNQIKVVGFTLDNNGTVHLKGTGAGGDKELQKVHNYQDDPFNLFAYAWIIDASSRKLVWRMTIENSNGDWWDKTNRTFDENLKLPQGEYELYFSAIEPNIQSGFLTLGKLLEKFFGDDDWEEHSAKWDVSLSGANATLSEDAVLKYQRALKDNAIVNITNVRNGQYSNRGFSLSKATDVEIYSLGEGWKDEMFDYCWLVDANTRQKIWQMKERNTEPAGGATKNRLARKNLTLDKGDYILYYKSDGTHSYEEWNANPPYDPEFWGVTIFAANKNFDKSVVTEYREKKLNSIVEITRVGDSDYREEGLLVEKTGSFRVYALGEGKDGKMYDYGWITDAKTGDTIWKMDYFDTEPGGGSSKNRQVNEIIELQKGNYIIHYKTDGSHSYNDWNASAPDEPEKWGISLYPVDSDQNAKKVNPYKLKDERIIAQLTRVGDDEHLRHRFELDRETKIRIKAIGEGDWDEMFDYGWIVDEHSGRKVWRMRYSNTDHAGGAKKNRMVDTIITLGPGVYTVHYISDDSHSYNNWNMSAPYDENEWGITLYRIDNP
jgi:hypothetical protein